jgi:hypothetical protein
VALWPVRFEIGRDMTLAAPEAGCNGFRGAHTPPISHNQLQSLVDHIAGHTTLLTMAEQVHKRYEIAIHTHMYIELMESHDDRFAASPPSRAACASLLLGTSTAADSTCRST